MKSCLRMMKELVLYVVNYTASASSYQKQKQVLIILRFTQIAVALFLEF